jgi:glycine/D-amino acid oxidase-like deaminating enzyme
MIEDPYHGFSRQGKARLGSSWTKLQLSMKFDVAIVGSGLAGLSVALHLAQTRTVAIISKRALLDGASNWAQGGIAAVLDSGDSTASTSPTRSCRRRPVRRGHATRLSSNTAAKRSAG